MNECLSGGHVHNGTLDVDVNADSPRSFRAWDQYMNTAVESCWVKTNIFNSPNSIELTLH